MGSFGAADRARLVFDSAHPLAEQVGEKRMIAQSSKAEASLKIGASFGAPTSLHFHHDPARIGAPRLNVSVGLSRSGKSRRNPSLLLSLRMPRSSHDNSRSFVVATRYSFRWAGEITADSSHPAIKNPQELWGLKEREDVIVRPDPRRWSKCPPAEGPAQEPTATDSLESLAPALPPRVAGTAR
jgi:hypothetical protein